MPAESEKVILAADPGAGGMQAHHRDFPEIRSRGQNPAEAVQQLQNQLTRALDSALTEWRRGTIQAALDDVQAVARSHAG